jgi:A/G-specific adenine glycosylase
MKVDHQVIRAFRRKVLSFYRRHGRKLPFRDTSDPYAITVAEVMLQQTQVERVVAKYLTWIRRWPDWHTLARATRQDLLAAWSGLGYNRRALYLGEIAKVVVSRFGGDMPSDPEVLQKLPGIGRYTSRAIAIFAFNRPLIAIDTNIRKVLIHEFSLSPDTSLSDFEALALRLLPPGRSREWHNALMDYARIAIRRDLAAIAPVSRQSQFKGSRREIRGAIIRRLTNRQRVSIERLARELTRTSADVRDAALTLAQDGIVAVTEKTIRLL